MIRIITGPVDSGKTTRMLGLYQLAVPGTAGGFVSRKLFRNEAFAGYEISRLADGESRILAVLADEESAGTAALPRDSFLFGRFIFFNDAFRFGESIIEALQQEPGITDLYLDEIGLIELNGQGFAPLLDRLDKPRLNLNLCIRSDCLAAAVERFGLYPYTII